VLKLAFVPQNGGRDYMYCRQDDAVVGPLYRLSSANTSCA